VPEPDNDKMEACSRRWTPARPDRSGAFGSSLTMPTAHPFSHGGGAQPDSRSSFVPSAPTIRRARAFTFNRYGLRASAACCPSGLGMRRIVLFGAAMIAAGPSVLSASGGLMPLCGTTALLMVLSALLHISPGRDLFQPLVFRSHRGTAWPDLVVSTLSEFLWRPIPAWHHRVRLAPDMLVFGFSAAPRS